MVKLQIIIGSTRPGRKGETIAQWVYEIAKKRTDIEVELVDIADYNLPLLDEPHSAMMNQYTKDHTKKWSAKISEADGYIMVTPEYNHSTSAALKNAIDYLYHEWANKAVGFVGYGVAGGIRAAEQLRQIAAQIQLADVQEQVRISLVEDFENYSVFKPGDHLVAQLDKQLNQLTAWSEAMKTVRTKASQSK